MRFAVCLSLFAAGVLSGCTPSVPAQQLYQAQLHSRNLYAMQQQVVAENLSMQQMAQGLESEKQALLAEQQQLAMQAQRAVDLEGRLVLANQRITNLMTERTQMKNQFVSALDQQHQASTMPGSVADRFQDLADRYPDIEFDPTTGVSKFGAEIFFASGSDRLRSEAQPILRQFADILAQRDADSLRILVVGHTDDRRIRRKSTHTEHPTNWHLSTDRANSVVLALKQFGIGEHRMATMGYSKFQPVSGNIDDSGRQQNRRVEIYVLAPEASIAGNWDPHRYN